MKQLSEMSTEELGDFWAGKVIAGIGKGAFQSEIYACILSSMQIGFEKGLEEGKKREREKMKRKNPASRGF